MGFSLLDLLDSRANTHTRTHTYTHTCIFSHINSSSELSPMFWVALCHQFLSFLDRKTLRWLYLCVCVCVCISGLHLHTNLSNTHSESCLKYEESFHGLLMGYGPDPVHDSNNRRFSNVSVCVCVFVCVCVCGLVNIHVHWSVKPLPRERDASQPERQRRTENIVFWPFHQ